MHVRPAAPSDAERIAVVARASCEAVYEGLLDDPALFKTVRSEDYADGVRALLRSVPGTPGLRDDVVEAAGRVEGFAQYWFAPAETEAFVDPGECLLHSLYVPPDVWGEGLGTALVDTGARASRSTSRRSSSASWWATRGVSPSTSPGGSTAAVRPSSRRAAPRTTAECTPGRGRHRVHSTVLR